MKVDNNNNKNINAIESINTWFDKTYEHTFNAIEKQIGYNQNKSALMPFDLFFGKMVECIVYEYFKSRGYECTIPDFNLYENCSDGGVDLILNNSIKVSVKLRKLNHNKETYFDDTLFHYEKQYDEAKCIIEKLKADNKVCDIIVGAIRYQTGTYGDWLDAWVSKDVAGLKDITKEMIEKYIFWFTTENENIEFIF